MDRQTREPGGGPHPQIGMPLNIGDQDTGRYDKPRSEPGPAFSHDTRPAGQWTPLPPSRRQQDVNVQWVVVFVMAIVMIFVVALVLAVRPSKRSTPTPGAPSTHSQQDCGYTYLPCPTTGRPR